MKPRLFVYATDPEEQEEEAGVYSDETRESKCCTGRKIRIRLKMSGAMLTFVCGMASRHPD